MEIPCFLCALAVFAGRIFGEYARPARGHPYNDERFGALSAYGSAAKSRRNEKEPVLSAKDRTAKNLREILRAAPRNA